jgi:hypothetical protein
VANEKDVRERPHAWVSKNLCSVTGRPCKCDDGRGCRRGEPVLDKPTVETLRHLRTARLYAQAAAFKIDDVLGDEHLLQRRYPQPEAREVRRKLATAISMIDEICGDLK